MSDKLINDLKRLQRFGQEDSKAIQKLKSACTNVAFEIIERTIFLKEEGKALILPDGYKIEEVPYFDKETSTYHKIYLLIGSFGVVNVPYGKSYNPGGDKNVTIKSTTRDQCLKFAADISNGLLGRIYLLIAAERKRIEKSNQIMKKISDKYVYNKKGEI